MIGGRFELVDVEQRVQHARHGCSCVVEPRDQLQSLFLLVFSDPSVEHAAHQAECLQRLAEVMACSGEKARFGDVGELGFAFGRLQSIRCMPPLGDVGKGDDDAFDAIVLGR